MRSGDEILKGLQSTKYSVDYHIMADVITKHNARNIWVPERNRTLSASVSFAVSSNLWAWWLEPLAEG